MNKRIIRLFMLLSVLLFLAGCDAKTSETETKSSQIAQNTQETESDSEAITGTEYSSGTEEKNEPTVTTFTISATGDCALGALQTHGYSGSFHQYYDKNGESYFFQNFRDIFEADDLTLVNLECVLTEETERVEKKFNIKGYPGYAGILTSSSIEACSLANNHTRDYGEASFIDTKEALDSVGVLYAYEDVVAYYETEGGVKVALVSAYLLSTRTKTEPILMEALATARKEADLVIVSCHWGDENVYKINDYQQKTAHKLIDAGADLIIGHHSHILQAMEYYKGKVICYSLGNFCFGANRNPADKNTIVYQQTFTFVDGELQADLDARIIPSRISGKNNANNYQPVIAEGEQAAEILNKMKEYSEPYSELSFTEDGKLITE